MKNLFAITIPILSGKTEEFKKFMDQLKNGRFNEFKESRKKLGVRERTFLQNTPMGDFIIVTLEGENPAESFAKFGQGKDEFTTWFIQQVKNIHGIDLASPPSGTLPEMVIDSEGLPMFA